jgi:hypothetical protein
MVGVDQLEHVTELCDGGNCEEAVLRMWEGMEVEAGKEAWTSDSSEGPNQMVVVPMLAASAMAPAAVMKRTVEARMSIMKSLGMWTDAVILVAPESTTHASGVAGSVGWAAARAGLGGGIKAETPIPDTSHTPASL